MSNQTFYKLASLGLGTFSIFLLFLIVTPFAESSDRKKDSVTLTDELRMHRQVFLEVINSKNPLISRDVKGMCKHGVEEIDEYLYVNGENITPEEEMKLRHKIKMIDWKIKNDPYYSSNLFYDEQNSMRM